MATEKKDGQTIEQTKKSSTDIVAKKNINFTCIRAMSGVCDAGTSEVFGFQSSLLPA